MALAKPPDKRDENLQQAIVEFGRIQQVLRRRAVADHHVKEHLREVLKLAPNHVSAKYLLLKGLRREPKQLSLLGSLRQIDVAAAPMIDAILQGAFEERESGLDPDAYGEAMSNLRALKPKLHQRTWKCADAIAEYAQLIRQWVNRRPKSYTNQKKRIDEIISVEGKLQREYNALMNSPDVRRELF